MRDLFPSFLITEYDIYHGTLYTFAKMQDGVPFLTRETYVIIVYILMKLHLFMYVHI
jgi:hypothetical protein